MAVGDIYSVQANFGCPDSAASILLYYREVELVDFLPATARLSLAAATRFATPFRNMMPSDYSIPSFVARKVFGDPEPKHRLDVGAPTGAQTPPGLPANNAVLFSLFQGTFSARSNGRFYVPGIPEDQTTIGRLNSAYMTGVINAVLTAFSTNLQAAAPATQGEWELGVISAKVRDAALPAKDWAGAFAPATSINATPIIATQRRRTTRIVGQRD